MSSTISLSELANTLSKEINNYASDIKTNINERIEACADEIISYLKTNTPKGESVEHLADSFVKTVVGNGAFKTVYVSSKTKYRLVHLIELGFRHTSGKYVGARTFLRPSYETLTPKMLNDIKEIIKNGT
jgi:hypothetical protein